MKFSYEYRTPDNVIHCDEIVAADREAAFQALRAKGIRPARLTESEGFFNKLFGKGKRWMAIAVLLVLALSFAYLWNGERAEVVTATRIPTRALRHQIYGEPAIMSEFENAGYTNVFADAASCDLASFAQPGVLPRFARTNWRTSMAKDLEILPQDDTPIAETDSREVRELKQIVNGMRAELSRYLANGNGTTASYVRRLEERQLREAQLYATVQRELENEKDVAKWQSRNQELRAIGLKTIPMPEIR